MQILQGAIAAGVILLVLDALWLGLLMRDWIDDQLHEFKREKILLGPAIVFYLLYAFALGFFAVSPALAQGDWMQAALLGGVLGLVAYGTYDLTNLATLNHWPWKMVIVDMAWGALVSALSASGAVAGLKWLGVA